MLFNYTLDELLRLCGHTLDLTKQPGATSVEADFSELLGQGVSVRLDEIGQIEFQQNKSLDIMVYVGQRKGRTSTADFPGRALQDTVKVAIGIACYTAEGGCAGPVDAALMTTYIGDFDRYHERDLSTGSAIDLAEQCEQAALSTDKRTESFEGTSVHTGHYQYVYGNTCGFAAYQQSTHHSISCSVVASDEHGMQRDHWYDSSCRHEDMDAPELISKTAAERTLRRLNSRSVPTGSYPVLFDTTAAVGLIGHLIDALSGDAFYRQNSFLIDSIGKQVLPELLSLREEPRILRLFRSTYSDAEGVATQPRLVVRDGVIKGYFLNSYSAKKPGMQTTGNAGGAHNLYLNHTHAMQADLLKEMGTGLLITELVGQGVNTITDDYSRGAAGSWMENDVTAYPVQETTIIGHLQDMYHDIIGVADDALRRSSNQIGFVSVSKMTATGN